MRAVREQTGKQILLVEDDEVLCNLLKESLLHEGYRVSALLSGEGIAKVMERFAPKLVVLDLMLPGKDGFYWLKWLKIYYPVVPVIIISAKVNPDERLQGLDEGALDYVVKPFYDKELLLRINNLFSRIAGDSERKLVRIGQLTLDKENHKVIRSDGSEACLTELECKILQMLHLNAGAFISREELVEQLLGVSYNPLNRSIDTHISRIRTKIEENPAAPVYIRTVRGKGYYLQIPEENTGLASHSTMQV